MTNTKPNSLSTRCMLVHLSISQWGGRKLDKAAASSAASAHGAEHDAIDAVLNLVPKSALKRIAAAASALRLWNYHYTLPWLDEGIRVLSSEGFFKYTQKFNELKADFNAAVADFEPLYQHAKEIAPRRLGTLYSAKDFPADIKRKFGVACTFMPFPDSADFRVQGLGSAEAEITANLDSVTAQISERAVQEVLDRVVATVSKVAERLKAYTGKREGAFRDTLITNCAYLAEVLPMLNINGDQRITDLAKEISALATHDPESLRESGAYRAQVANEATGILDKLSSFAGAPGTGSAAPATAPDYASMSAF